MNPQKTVFNRYNQMWFPYQRVWNKHTLIIRLDISSRLPFHRKIPYFTLVGALWDVYINPLDTMSMKYRESHCISCFQGAFRRICVYVVANNIHHTKAGHTKINQTCRLKFAAIYWIDSTYLHILHDDVMLIKKYMVPPHELNGFWLE